MILFRAELQFMNGEVRANIVIKRIPESQRAPLFLQRPSKTEETLAKATNTSANKVKVASSR
jgi:hypothetical protein